VPRVADATDVPPDPLRSTLRCDAPPGANDDVHVDPADGREFVVRDEREVARGGPWLRGATNPIGALVTPDADCGARVFEREEDADAIVVRARGCVAGLQGARSVQLFHNRNVSGLCAQRDGEMLYGRFEISQATLASRSSLRAASTLCGRGEWWGLALAGDGTGGRRLQFLDDLFRPKGPPYDLPREGGVTAPAAVVNSLNRWDALWRVDGDEALLHERYRPVGEMPFGAAYPTRIDSLLVDFTARWSAARLGASRVWPLEAFNTGGGLFALARLEAPDRAWVDGLLFCPGGVVHARRLYNGPVLDAMLVGLGAAHVLLTLHRDGDEQVVSATWISSDFSTRGRPQVLRHAPGLTLLGADVGPRVGSFLVWHSSPADGGHALYVSTYVLTR